MERTMTEHANIYTALCSAQAAMGRVTKGAINPAFKSRYADLADVVSVAVPALTLQGISLHHSMMRDEHGLIMRTTLSHGVSDTHIHCDVPLMVDRSNMQGMKSATTYAKRIGLESLTGIAPEDDDGNAAAAAAPKQEARRQAAPAHPLDPSHDKPITADQFRDLRKLVEKAGADEAKMLAWLKAPALEELTQAQFETAAAMLRKKIAYVEATA
jgi:hypothetical protein